MKKKCSKCKQVLAYSEFYKNKRSKDGLCARCKKCRSKYQREQCVILKREVMNVFGGRCTYMTNGIQCSKNSIDDLGDLTLSHPNNDGDEHRDLISNGQKGIPFYRALRKRGWNTNGFDIKVMCRSHHRTLDNSGEKHPNYKDGKFNNPAWLKKKYETMTTQEIADECEVSNQTIGRRLKKFNI